MKIIDPDVILGIFVQSIGIGKKRLEEHSYMLPLKCQSIKGLQTFGPMLHKKEKCFTINNRDGFRVICKLLR